jgi:hypothetical protein
LFESAASPAHHGPARLSTKCNPKTEVKQYISSSATPGINNEGGIHVVTIKHTFPVGYKPTDYKEEPSNWFSFGSNCPADEFHFGTVVKTPPYQEPNLKDGERIIMTMCDRLSSRVACGRRELIGTDGGYEYGASYPLDTPVDIYVGSLCAPPN